VIIFLLKTFSRLKAKNVKIIIVNDGGTNKVEIILAILSERFLSNLEYY